VKISTCLRRKTGKELTVSRSVALLTLLIAMVCLLAMTRHTDIEIKRADKAAQEAESRSADAIIKLIEVKDMYMRRLEELRICEHGN
jgi:hypothetical protein